MRVGLQTWGSEGDLRPFFALAEGLANAGHEVALQYASVDDRDHSDRLVDAPFRHRKVGSLGLTPSALSALGTRIFSERNPIRQLRGILNAMFEPVAGALTDGARELAASSDVMVHHFMVHPSAAAAEKVGKPSVAIHTAPLFPTRAIAVPGLPDMGRFNLLAWKLAEALMDRATFPSVARARAAMGLPAVRRSRDQHARSALDLLAVSPTLFPRPSDFPAKLRITGFLNPPMPPPAQALPEGLEAFIAEGPRPVLVTFGSMAWVEENAAGLFEIVTDAILEVGCRAILQTEPAAIPPALRSHPRILRIGSAPHDAIFPACAAIVHHGGAGTTQAALRAGRPSVIVAHFGDQPLWGRILFKHGVAPRHLSRSTVTAPRLAAAIRRALVEPEMATRAATFGAGMGREDGVAEAVRAIEEAARSGKPGPSTPGRQRA